MAWIKKTDVAMFKGANWNTLIKKVPNCTPEMAKRIAIKNPKITFFFFCREYMVLETLGDKGIFNPGDAVFFSGEPWYGSAPQCDSYEKTGMSVAYVSLDKIQTTGCYTMADGDAAVDVVCIFAANINKKPLPAGMIELAPNTQVPDGYPYAVGSSDYSALTVEAVQKLQKKGITVLLTFLNNHDGTGWSEFPDATTATNFAQQLKEVVDRLGLDGIDIDDEYSDNPNPNPSSLVTVTTIMKQLMPDIIISKALFDDYQYFTPKYNNQTLADNLTYGWEMSYGGAPKYRLPDYTTLGMATDTLVCGFWSGQPSPSPADDVSWLKTNGYEGVMVYAFQEQSNIDLLGSLVNDWNGNGNWNKTPNCP
ncbi:glycosyl hydrolase family 18 (putative chitinase) [Flavobacterium sp. 270]|uniref:glycosyl hydrolase family 18 protein n=1 Tax=Flavobacterium sp. 270 TaxID=2512114 RepID=UPI001065A26A|nr:glycosyl hydrolase family 18 protein [Flavobacterium sp. 270]TDW47226.1 glycosyl hydrolase family 18 (putative chitinase) [Flavobacterium sp. 270]